MWCHGYCLWRKGGHMVKASMWCVREFNNCKGTQSVKFLWKSEDLRSIHSTQCVTMRLGGGMHLKSQQWGKQGQEDAWRLLATQPSLIGKPHVSLGDSASKYNLLWNSTGSHMTSTYLCTLPPKHREDKDSKQHSEAHLSCSSFTWLCLSH